MSEVRAIGTRRTNAEAIRDCAQLGYLTETARTLDTTYGLGRFWALWRPTYLVQCDLNPARASGWRVLAERPARPGWSSPSRPREDRGVDGIPRTLWEAS